MLCALSAKIRFAGEGWGVITANTLIHYVYFGARALSPLSVIGSRGRSPQRRAGALAEVAHEHP